MFFHFINKLELIFVPPIGKNLDDSNTSSNHLKGEKYLSFDIGNTDTVNIDSLETSISTSDCLYDINRIINTVGDKLNIKIADPIDGLSEGEVLPTTKYIIFKIPALNKAIMSILSYNEMLRLNYNEYVFFVGELDYQVGDFDIDPIFTVSDIVNRLKNVQLGESKRVDEGGHSFTDIADEIYNDIVKSKKQRQWQEIAMKKIKVWTKSKDDIQDIMNILHGEDYFDDGEMDF